MKQRSRFNLSLKSDLYALVLAILVSTELARGSIPLKSQTKINEVRYASSAQKPSPEG